MYQRPTSRAFDMLLHVLAQCKPKTIAKPRDVLLLWNHLHVIASFAATQADEATEMHTVRTHAVTADIVASLLMLAFLLPNVNVPYHSRNMTGESA